MAGDLVNGPAGFVKRESHQQTKHTPIFDHQSKRTMVSTAEIIVHWLVRNDSILVRKEQVSLTTIGTAKLLGR